MNLVDFVEEGYVIISVVLYVLGIFIKKTEFIKDKYIPITLMLLGIVGALLINYSMTEAVFQGILCAGIAVLGNETVKQLGKVE